MKRGQCVDTALCRDTTASVITELVTSLSCSTAIRMSKKWLQLPLFFFISFSCCSTALPNETVISPPSAEQKITSIILRHAYFRLWFKDLKYEWNLQLFLGCQGQDRKARIPQLHLPLPGVMPRQETQTESSEFCAVFVLIHPWIHRLEEIANYCDTGKVFSSSSFPNERI